MDASTHPLLQQAHAAMLRGDCRREVPVSVCDADLTIVEGVVDLAFLDDVGGTQTWTVIDFKTDRELDPALDIYRRQVALYAEMISRATGHAALPVLVRI